MRKILLILLLFYNINIIKSYNVVLNIGSTGLLLPYSLGILGYIKQNINITKPELIGISGGSYCTLLYRYENDLSNHDYIWKNIFGLNDTTKIDLYNLGKYQKKTNNFLINRYKNINVDESNIKIITTEYHGILNKHKKMFDNYKNTEDLIYKCYCSSYIPYISGNRLFYEYDNCNYFDGAFSSKNNDDFKSYIKDNKILKKIEIIDNKKIININCNTWGRKWELGSKHYLDIKTSRLLYNNGWDDTKKNIFKIF